MARGAVDRAGDCAAGDAQRYFRRFRAQSGETARVLLERDLAFCVASDGHGTAYRRPILEDVNAWLTEHFGAAYAERMLHENPRRILSGEAGKERIA